MAVLSFESRDGSFQGSCIGWSDKQFDHNLIAVYAASHFLVFFTAFFVLHQKPWADLVACYVPEAHAVMHGLGSLPGFSVELCTA